MEAIALEQLECRLLPVCVRIAQDFISSHEINTTHG
jgi:hypothetical protein